MPGWAHEPGRARVEAQSQFVWFCLVVCVFLSTDQKMQMEFSLNANIFPLKLWRLVNDMDIDAIVWNHHGDGIIVNKKLIEKEFLSSNGFKATSSSSFIRQLNFYGFKKSQRFNRDNVHHYFHPNFKRTRPELLPLLRRCNQRSRPSVKADVSYDLTDTWGGQRDLNSGDETRDANLHHSESHFQCCLKEVIVTAFSNSTGKSDRFKHAIFLMFQQDTVSLNNYRNPQPLQRSPVPVMVEDLLVTPSAPSCPSLTQVCSSSITCPVNC